MVPLWYHYCDLFGLKLVLIFLTSFVFVGVNTRHSAFDSLKRALLPLLKSDKLFADALSLLTLWLNENSASTVLP